MTPTEVTLTPEHELNILWSDGHSVSFSLQFLRDECPCASCKGETGLLGVHYSPMQLPIMTPGKYELTAVEPVGNYALSLRWGDGHSTGIYSWEYLLNLERYLRTPSNGTDGATTP